jgi:GNAT superfamily N-acetyltransferase
MDEVEGMDRSGRGRLPPGYPPEYQRHVKLQDGRQVFIRPILPSDAAELARAIKTADADTLRRRFLGGPPAVTPALLAHLTRLDYQRRFALVAIDPATGHGVAIARYEPAGDDTAEVAVAVSPSWRHVGLATALIALLAQAALERGIVTFTASYLAANRPVAALVGRADGHGRQVIEQGIAEFSVALEQHDAAGTTRSQAPGGHGGRTSREI